MCTAMKIGGLFGRTLDLEHGYGEAVVLTPRDFPFAWRHLPPTNQHYAILGMAAVAQGFPLYYDAVNECGLGMAGLNFPHSGWYGTPKEGDVASFELLPYLLGRCATVAQAKEVLRHLWVCDTAFSAAYPPTKLHWMVADKRESIVVESTVEGLAVYDNPLGVMTNEPPFPRQLQNWADSAPLTAEEPSVTPPHLGRGSGSEGLAGGFSSPARFRRGAFVAAHSEGGEDAVGQFFHAIGTVEVPRGCVRLPDGGRVISRYTSCMDLGEKVYYYRTYGCHRIHAVRLTAEGDTLRTYPLPPSEDIKWVE